MHRLLTFISLSALTLCGQNIISTIAGADWVFNGDGRPALDAPLGEPRGVYAHPDGSVYFVDRGNRMLMKIDSHGILHVVAGNGLSGSKNLVAAPAAKNVPLQFMNDVVGDGAGTLYVSDPGAIYRITPEGRITIFAGGGSQLPSDGGPAIGTSINPFNLALDKAGNLFFADYGNHRVRRISTNGVLTTVAGNGTQGATGDGGPSVQASLNFPYAVAVDADGTLYIGQRDRIRKVDSNGVISSVLPATGATMLLIEPSGNLIYGSGGQLFRIESNGRQTALGFGGPNRIYQAAALGADGAIIVTDAGENKLFRRTSDGQIRELAGNGEFRVSPPGSPAIGAFLFNPRGVAINPLGSVLVADTENSRIVEVSSGGKLAVLSQLRRFTWPRALVPDDAGGLYYNASSSIEYLSATGVSRTVVTPRSERAPTLVYAWGLAADASNNLFISDLNGHRIYKLPPTGQAEIVAGTGTAGFSGDSGRATQAMLNAPRGLALDATGNLYVADTGNHRIRKIASDGTITTVAGSGVQGFAGDGGSPLLARLSSPGELALDPVGRLLISDPGNNRIRRVTFGHTIESVAGIGNAGFSGDGGLATAARLASPSSIVVDSSGTIYFADSGNDRIRVIRPSAAFDASPATISLTGQASATVRLSTATPGLAFTAASNAEWLTVSPSSGTLPTELTVTATPGNRAPGQYSARITVNVPLASPPTREIAVTLTVPSSQPPKLGVGSPSISFAYQQGAAPPSSSISLSNDGGGSLEFTASVRSTSGGAWLAVSPNKGQLTAGASSTLAVTTNPATLADGTYSATITIASSSANVTVPVSISVSRPQGKILLSQTGLTFTAVQGGGAPSPQTFAVLNEGSGELPFEARATLLSGANWLRLNNASGRLLRPLQDLANIEVVPDTSKLTQGDYYAEIRVTSPGLSPQIVTAVVKVLPPGANPGPEVRPSGLVFIGSPGAALPSEDVRVSNLLANPTTFISTSQTFDGAKWMSHVPATATVHPNAPNRVVVQPDFTGLAPGVRRGAIFLLFEDGSSRSVNVLSIVPPAVSASSKQPGREAASCNRPTLRSEFLSLPENTLVSVGQPVSIEVKAADECGNLLLGNERNANSAVFAKFSNGDADLRLVPIGNGVWTGSWRPLNAAAGNVVVSAVSLYVQGLTVQGGRSDRSVRVAANASAPIIRQGSLVHGATQRGDAPIAPGSLVTIYGANLASAPKLSVAPLPTEVDGTQVLLGGQPLPILFSSATQINVQVPFNLPVNTEQQVVVRRAATLSVPESFLLAGAQPGIFTANLQGTGQGIVMGPDQVTLATPSSPALRGQPIVIYCTGLGAVSLPVEAGSPAPNTQLSTTTLPVEVRIADTPATVLFSGLTPGFAGLYQVNAIVPAATTPGDAVPVTLSVAGQIGNTVTIAVR